jgi:hypothetical protein
VKQDILAKGLFKPFRNLQSVGHALGFFRAGCELLGDVRNQPFIALIDPVTFCCTSLSVWKYSKIENQISVCGGLPCCSAQVCLSSRFHS